MAEPGEWANPFSPYGVIGTDDSIHMVVVGRLGVPSHQSFVEVFDMFVHARWVAALIGGESLRNAETVA